MIRLSEYSGFCPGVRRADRIVNEPITNNPKARIFTLGELIHNTIYVSELESKGVRSISLAEIEDVYFENDDLPMIVVIRTHGIT